MCFVSPSRSGAQTVTLDGPTVAGTLIDYARLRAISRIVVGEPARRGWRDLVQPSTATELARGGHGFDLSIIARRAGPQERERHAVACRSRDSMEPLLDRIAGFGDLHGSGGSDVSVF